MATGRQAGSWTTPRIAPLGAAAFAFVLATTDVAGAAPALESPRTIPFLPAASDPRGRLGLVRVINRSPDAGTVSIEAFDDEGQSYDPLTLSLDANETAHFDSDDLENGNADKGLTGGTGAGEGDWRLELATALDIDVLAYIRTSDGFLTSIRDTVRWEGEGHRVAIFNPGSNRNQESLLRLANIGEADATVAITGMDDAGAPGAGTVTVDVPARGARTVTASELESGGAAGQDGSLGDGVGKWQLALRSEHAITALDLLSSPDGLLTNLSTIPGNVTDGIHVVPFFPRASDPLGRQGFVRVINHSDVAGEVSITAFDDMGREYEPLAMSLGANETKHFNSDDLELGNPDKGLTGSTGTGVGDWRLDLTSDLEIDVLVYVRTTGGLLTAMHDTVPREGDVHRIATFNPHTQAEQASRLRLVNPGEATAQVTISGIDDLGEDSSGEVAVAIPAGASRTLTSHGLEAGGDGFDGALGDGVGRWQLMVESEQPIIVLNLLSGPTGQITNLSSEPPDAVGFAANFHRGTQGFVADFADYPPDDPEPYELTSDYRPLPPPLESKSALFISGVNRSDDLFMFFKGHVGGLVPGARYVATATAEIATRTPAGCVGVGGAPGESVWIKAAASEVEPLPVLEGSFLRMNIDIGNQSNAGDQSVVLGNMANSRNCEQPRQWERKSFPDGSIPEPVTASASGRVWLLFGVDSGFESLTEVYFTRASVSFAPR